MLSKMKFWTGIELGSSHFLTDTQPPISVFFFKFLWKFTDNLVQTFQNSVTPFKVSNFDLVFVFLAASGADFFKTLSPLSEVKT